MSAQGDRHDLVVIGAGQAGPFLAASMAKRGAQVALTEARHLGGTCVNSGCTPTKTLRKSAVVAHMVRRAAEFGVRTGPVTLDFEAAMDRMHRRVDEARSGLTRWLAGISGLDVVHSEARFVGRRGEDFVVAVDGRELCAPRVAINTGTRPVVPAPFDQGASVPYLTNETVLELRTLPRALLILGGGYIGLEFAQIFARFGSRVTVIEPSARIASHEDPDVAAVVRDILAAEGVEFVLGSAVRSARGTPYDGGDGVELTLSNGTMVQGSHVLVATGRAPNTEHLDLGNVGLATDARGFIDTDGTLETSVRGIFALGDVNRRGAFTHTSYHDHEVVLANWTGGRRTVADRIWTYALFIDPPLGHVGVHEAEALRIAATGRHVTMCVLPMSQVSRAKEESETLGLVKIFVDEEQDRFLGATIVGIGADEIVQSIGRMMAAGGTVTSFVNALPIHPTVTEYLPTILAQRRPLTASS
jgi:pyruvate/2-oxoglutarate dehydrogenase complex dihydrolipoamide dehydrogenase (E3) component